MVYFLWHLETYRNIKEQSNLEPVLETDPRNTSNDKHDMLSMGTEFVALVAGARRKCAPPGGELCYALLQLLTPMIRTSQIKPKLYKLYKHV